ncbi:unnamed protein product [Notodromas monacha]|uniref:Uncharacterized protein n=1 Tax=Notodromas monacha TaxID=399045 RepID=A0A7R9BDL2_9CRUS|nr:unnamed protein product [Notodromas monacha]CAG0913435.1 unnamed protein product [Notodromas monacha]
MAQTNAETQEEGLGLFVDRNEDNGILTARSLSRVKHGKFHVSCMNLTDEDIEGNPDMALTFASVHTSPSQTNAETQEEGLGLFVDRNEDNGILTARSLFRVKHGKFHVSCMNLTDEDIEGNPEMALTSASVHMSPSQDGAGSDARGHSDEAAGALSAAAAEVADTDQGGAVDEAAPSVAATGATGQPCNEDGLEKKKRNRCAICKKKLGLTGWLAYPHLGSDADVEDFSAPCIVIVTSTIATLTTARTALRRSVEITPLSKAKK